MSPSPTREGEERRSGWIELAAALLALAGIGQLIFGFAAIGGSATLVRNVTEVETTTGLHMYASLETWGLLMVVVGVAQVAAAVLLLRRPSFVPTGGLMAAYAGLIVALLTFAIVRIPTIALVAVLLFAVYLLSYDARR